MGKLDTVLGSVQGNKSGLCFLFYFFLLLLFFVTAQPSSGHHGFVWHVTKDGKFFHVCAYGWSPVCWRSIFFSAAATWELSPALRNVDSNPSAVFSSCIRNRSYRHRQPLFFFVPSSFLSTDSVAFWLPSNRQTREPSWWRRPRQTIDRRHRVFPSSCCYTIVSNKKKSFTSNLEYNLSFPSLYVIIIFIHLFSTSPFKRKTVAVAP